MVYALGPNLITTYCGNRQPGAGRGSTKSFVSGTGKTGGS